MKLFFLNNSIFCILFYLAGCAAPVPPAKPPTPEKDRLTIKDLKPSDGVDLQPQMIFNWVEFEMDSVSIELFNSELNFFSAEPIQFQNASLYKQNGISVFFGKSEYAAKLTQQLAKVSAKRTKRTIIMMMDKMPQFYEMSSSASEKVVYFTTIGSQKTQRIYPIGQFGLMLNAELTSKPDAVKVDCQPAFMPALGLFYYDADAKQTSGASYLPPGIFKTTMNEGDFLILAPSRKTTDGDLDSVLFSQFASKDKVRVYVLIFIRTNY